MSQTLRLMLLGAVLLFGFGAADALAQTQLDMNQEACQAHYQADQKLNEVYQAVRQRLGPQSKAWQQVQKAQIAWLAYRDAHLKAIFPEADTRAHYGSVYPMCHCRILEEMSRHRTAELETWLSAPEGDVCLGSRIPATDE